MPEIEPRLPCPTCLGVKMDKLKPVRSHELVLDCCRRCGGVWFDAGEVRALREARPKGLDGAVELRETAHMMTCHSCHASMDRNGESCPSCGWKNRIDCPVCQKEMERIEKDGLTLDACRSCRGVWFDNHELAQIWNLEMKRRLPVSRRSDGVAEYFMLETLLWAPDLVWVAGEGLAHGAGAVAGAAGNLADVGVDGVAEVAGGAVEAVGDAAGGVFEVIAEIIGGLFG